MKRVIDFLDDSMVFLSDCFDFEFPGTEVWDLGWRYSEDGAYQYAKDVERDPNATERELRMAGMICEFLDIVDRRAEECTNQLCVKAAAILDKLDREDLETRIPELRAVVNCVDNDDAYLADLFPPPAAPAAPVAKRRPRRKAT